MSRASIAKSGGIAAFIRGISAGGLEAVMAAL
jgi:hypothetical protein